MEELIDIANYTNTVVIKYGSYINSFTVTYLDKDDVLDCKIQFKYPYEGRTDFLTYQICSFNFTMSDTNVLVNKYSIDDLNSMIEKYINLIKENVTV